MTRHDDAARVRHALDYARQALELSAGHRRQDLDADRLLRYALTPVVEVIGEAAAHVSPAFQQQHPAIP
jgi:uncharacterized protein with HEPN domain